MTKQLVICVDEKQEVCSVDMFDTRKEACHFIEEDAVRVHDGITGPGQSLIDLCADSDKARVIDGNTVYKWSIYPLSITEKRKALETVFLGSDTVIVTENADGEPYVIRSKYLRDIFDDWWCECNFVPANDARVFFAMYNGKPISPYEYSDFESLLRRLCPVEWF